MAADSELARLQRVVAARRRYRNALAALTEGAENHTFSSGKGQE
jgi:hypothetical protein